MTAIFEVLGWWYPIQVEMKLRLGMWCPVSVGGQAFEMQVIRLFRYAPAARDDPFEGCLLNGGRSRGDKRVTLGHQKNSAI